MIIPKLIPIEIEKIKKLKLEINKYWLCRTNSGDLDFFKVTPKSFENRPEFIPYCKALYNDNSTEDCTFIDEFEFELETIKLIVANITHVYFAENDILLKQLKLNNNGRKLQNN